MKNSIFVIGLLTSLILVFLDFVVIALGVQFALVILSRFKNIVDPKFIMKQKQPDIFFLAAMTLIGPLFLLEMDTAGTIVCILFLAKQSITDSE